MQVKAFTAAADRTAVSPNRKACTYRVVRGGGYTQRGPKTHACSDREKGAGKLAAAATPLDQKGGQYGSDDTACSLIGVR